MKLKVFKGIAPTVYVSSYYPRKNRKPDVILTSDSLFAKELTQAQIDDIRKWFYLEYTFEVLNDSISNYH